jgi:hypothetical protein
MEGGALRRLTNSSRSYIDKGSRSSPLQRDQLASSRSFTSFRMTSTVELFPIFPGVDIDRSFRKRELSNMLGVLQNN